VHLSATEVEGKSCRMETLVSSRFCTTYLNFFG
jgi:hypothetical protein